MNKLNFDQKSGFQLFIRFSVSKAAPAKAKPNEREPLIINQSNFCHDKLLKKLVAVKKLNILFGLRLFTSWRARTAAILKGSYNGANNPSPYPVFSTKFE